MEFKEVIKSVVYKLGRNKPRQDREDFEQECQIAIFENQDTIDKLDTPDKQKRFVYIICRNRIVDLLRKEKECLSLSVDEVRYEAEKVEAVEQDIESFLDGEQVVQYLNKLHEPLATIITLRFGIDCDPWTLEEVAARFGKTEGWVREQEKLGLEKLREMMDANR